MSDTTVRPATETYVRTAEPAVRLVRDEKPSPTAHTTARTSARSSSVVSSPTGGVPPALNAQTTNGTDTARNASEDTQAARSLPSTISAGLRSVTWSVASVPAARSPLIDVAESVGETTMPRNSTKKTMKPNIDRPT